MISWETRRLVATTGQYGTQAYSWTDEDNSSGGNYYGDSSYASRSTWNSKTGGSGDTSTVIKDDESYVVIGTGTHYRGPLTMMGGYGFSTTESYAEPRHQVTTTRTAREYIYSTTTTAQTVTTSSGTSTGTVTSNSQQTTCLKSRSTTTATFSNVNGGNNTKYTTTAFALETISLHPLARYVMDTVYEALNGNSLMVATWTGAARPATDMVLTNKTTISCLEVMTTVGFEEPWGEESEVTALDKTVDTTPVTVTLPVNLFHAFPADTNHTSTYLSWETSLRTGGEVSSSTVFTSHPHFTIPSKTFTTETVTETSVMGLGFELFTYERTWAMLTTTEGSVDCRINSAEGYTGVGVFAAALPMGGVVPVAMQYAAVVDGGRYYGDSEGDRPWNVDELGSIVHSTNLYSAPKGLFLTGSGFTLWDAPGVLAMVGGAHTPWPVESAAVVLNNTSYIFTETDNEYGDAGNTYTSTSSIDSSLWSSLTLAFTTGGVVKYTMSTSNSSTAGSTATEMSVGVAGDFPYVTTYANGELGLQWEWGSPVTVGGLQEAWKQQVTLNVLHGFILGNDKSGTFSRAAGSSVLSAVTDNVSAMSIYPLVIGPLVKEYVWSVQLNN